MSKPLLPAERAATLPPMSAPPKSIATPCTLVCVLNPANGFCYGCQRTAEEIERWTRYSGAEREAIMAQLKARAKSAG